MAIVIAFMGLGTFVVLVSMAIGSAAAGDFWGIGAILQGFGFFLGFLAFSYLMDGVFRRRFWTRP